MGVLDAGTLHSTASRFLNEDPRGFLKDAKKAYMLALRNELIRSLDFSVDDRQANRTLPRLSIDISRNRSNGKMSTTNLPSNGIFNLRSEGIDLDSVMLSLINENNSELISSALHLMRRNRR